MAALLPKPPRSASGVIASSRLKLPSG